MGNSQTKTGRKTSTTALGSRTNQDLTAVAAKTSQQKALVENNYRRPPAEPQYRPKKKIVLLGAGDSGKSTISKQIKLLQLGGYTRREILSFAPTIRVNSLIAIRTYLDEIPQDKFKALMEEKGNAQFKEAIQVLRDATVLTEEACNAVNTIWSAPKIHQAWKGRLGTKESAKFFVGSLDRISEQQYVPTTDDILRARAKTTGIIELTFTYAGFELTIIDVGGQRSERKKWAQCFENVSAVIWCASLSEYDEVLYEDMVTNRLEESLNLFEGAVQSQWFSQADVIIFFNKEDLFRQKIQEVDLKVCFEDYTGGKDYEKALSYIKKEYERRSAGIARVYSVVLTATESSSVHKALAKVISVVVEENVKGSKTLTALRV